MPKRGVLGASDVSADRAKTAPESAPGVTPGRNVSGGSRTTSNAYDSRIRFGAQPLSSQPQSSYRTGTFSVRHPTKRPQNPRGLVRAGFFFPRRRIFLVEKKTDNPPPGPKKTFPQQS